MVGDLKIPTAHKRLTPRIAECVDCSDWRREGEDLGTAVSCGLHCRVSADLISRFHGRRTTYSQHDRLTLGGAFQYIQYNLKMRRAPLASVGVMEALYRQDLNTESVVTLRAPHSHPRIQLDPSGVVNTYTGTIILRLVVSRLEAKRK